MNFEKYQTLESEKKKSIKTCILRKISYDFFFRSLSLIRVLRLILTNDTRVDLW